MRAEPVSTSPVYDVSSAPLGAAGWALYVFLLFEQAGGAPFPNRFLDDAQHAAAGRGPRMFLLGGEQPAPDERTAP